MLCDQIFRYFEPAESKGTFKIPNFLQDTEAGDKLPLDRMTLVCSNKDAKIEAITPTEFVVTAKTGKSGSKQVICVFVYKDHLQTKLVGVCKIEVSAVALVVVDVFAGKEQEQILDVMNIPRADGSSAQRVVEVFSLDPEIIYAPQGKSRNLQMLQNITKFPQ